MKLRSDLDNIWVDDFYYDVFVGGYLSPENILGDQEDIDRINEAMEVMKEYFEFLEDHSEEI